MTRWPFDIAATRVCFISKCRCKILALDSEKSLSIQPSNGWYNSVICSYKKKIFQVYAFPEQVAAKANSLEATW